MRTTYGSPSQLTYAGEIVSDMKRIKSAPAKEKIAFGSVVGFTGTSNQGFQNPSANKFTFSGDLVTSNTVNLNVEIKTIDSNGNEATTGAVAISQVTFSTNNLTTMNLIKAAIEALVDANSSLKLTATVGDSDHSISVVHSDQAVIIITGVVVAAGSGQATVTYQFDGTVVGTAVKCPVEQRSDGTVGYNPNMMVGAMSQGVMTVTFVDATTLASSLYYQHIANGATKPRGAIRTSTDSGKATAFSALKPCLGASALALGNVEINTP